jgi:hypothetical protein
MPDFNSSPELDIAVALTRVGELLARDGRSYEIVIVGGAALNLHGYVTRPTSDVDVIAFADGGRLSAPPEPLPDALLSAAATVARRMRLPADWLNTVAALQWLQGLPPGLADRVTWRDYGSALRVGLVGRRDLIFFKLYAAADDRNVNSVHMRDLLVLAPTSDEIAAAEVWVRSQDPSPACADLLDKVLNYVRAHIP